MPHEFRMGRFYRIPPGMHNSALLAKIVGLPRLANARRTPFERRNNTGAETRHCSTPAGIVRQASYDAEESFTSLGCATLATIACLTPSNNGLAMATEE